MDGNSEGCLVLVVGPSGVGKDSLLNAARQSLSSSARFHFPKRYITRSASAGGEDHIATSEVEIRRMIDNGKMALHWQAHDLIYGIAASSLKPLELGQHVVINVSRGIIDDARQRFGYMRVLSIQASRDELFRRLRARGRETESEIEKRVERAMAYDVRGDDVLTINNSKALEDSTTEVINLLKSL